MDATAGGPFGSMPDGREVRLLTIGSEPGPVVQVLTLGAAVHRLEVAGGDDVRRNVVLSLPDVEERLAGGGYVGGTIGRYANRIAGGRFDLDGTQVRLAPNDRGNNLHGGPDGFDVRLWDVREHGADEVVLGLVSPDGDQGFPGAVDVEVRYAVSADTVAVTMRATCDATTVVNLTNHAYFNLAGEGAGTIDDHLLQVSSEEFVPVDAVGIPLGDPAPVEGTPFDLRTATAVGVATAHDHPQLAWSGGFDHTFVVAGEGLRRAAVLSEPSTRTTLEVWSDQPGLQVYTGDALDGSRRSGAGGRHGPRDGVALEPGLYPDSPHHPGWPSPVLRPGETYRARIEWRLTTS